MKTYEALFQASLYLENNKWTKDTLSDLPTCKGVLLFSDSSGQPVQLLQAANCRRTAQAKLLHDDNELPPRKKADVSELTANISYTCCHNNFLTQTTYIHLAHVIYKKDADKWTQLPKPSFVVIELDTALPYFFVSNNPEYSEKRIVLGLFPNRKASLKYCEILNAAFCLCRNPSLLNSGKEKSCPYLQMQTCPGPCLKPALHKAYGEAVTQAIQVGNDGVEPALHQLTQQMQQSSECMDFEKASEIKKQLDQLTKLKTSNYRWVHNLKNLCILHVDKSVKKKFEGTKRKVLHYKWLKIVSNAVYDLGDFLPESHENIYGFLEQNWTTSPEISYASDINKHLGNLTYFLFRSKPSGFWLDCSNGIVAEQLHSILDEFLNSEKSP